MIVTLTPNPALDRTVRVEALVRGEVHRADAVRVEAAGKGVNVTRALAAHGVPSVAVVPVGGRSGTWYLDTLSTDHVDVDPVKVEGSLRTNVAIVEPDGTTTKVNEPGPALSSSEQQGLLDAVQLRVADGASWVVGCGSLPPQTDENLYCHLIAIARDHGARSAIDSSDAPFLLAVGARPSLIKPNLEELEQLVGALLPTLGDVTTAARQLVRDGIETVLVSLGARGALQIDANCVRHAQALVAHPLSTVGAGDAFLAGYLSVVDTTPDDALVTGVAWGAAAVGLPGSQMPGPADTRGIARTITVDQRVDLTSPSRGGNPT
jgi:1-phosphofructokinase